LCVAVLGGSGEEAVGEAVEDRIEAAREGDEGVYFVGEGGGKGVVRLLWGMSKWYCGKG
jgi:hypothetical protein